MKKETRAVNLRRPGIKDVNNICDESIKISGVLQRDRSCQDYTGPLLFLNKKLASSAVRQETPNLQIYN